jgi:uncharacterized membrane protein YozB (DUF420 family)
MADKFELRQWLTAARNNWGLLAQCAIWVLSVIGIFVLSPPADVSTDANKAYLGLVKFVVVVLSGLIIIVASKWHQQKHAIWWGVVTAVFLVSAIASFDAYQQRMESWTCRYVGARKIVGTSTDYTPQGRYYMDKNSSISCDDLIFAFAGRTDDIWTKESIDARRLLLSRYYLLSIVLFALCLLSVIQAIYCITTNNQSRSRPHRTTPRITRQPSDERTVAKIQDR